jgi:hypothetical protein
MNDTQKPSTLMRLQAEPDVSNASPTASEGDRNEQLVGCRRSRV